jgi:hypothetical protein
MNRKNMKSFLLTFISVIACEIGSFEFRYANEHIVPLKERIPETSFWLYAL